MRTRLLMGLSVAALAGCGTLASNHQALSSEQGRIILLCQGKAEAENGVLQPPDLKTMTTEQYQTYLLCVQALTKANGVKPPPQTALPGASSDEPKAHL